MRRWSIFFSSAMVLLLFFVLTPYAVVMTVLACIGLLSSAFIVFGWTPFIITAVVRDKAKVSTPVLLDFGGMTYLAFIVFCLRLFFIWKEGVTIPPDVGRQMIGVGVWFILTSVVTIRAYAWLQQLRKHPRDRLPSVVDKIDHRP